MLDAFRELIDELLSAPAALRGAGLATTTDDGQRTTLALITERDAALLDRIQTTIRTNTPLLKAPPDAPSAATLDGTSEELMDRFDTGRGELVSLLMNLTLKDWERTAIDWTGQEISVADDVEQHVEFDEQVRDELGG
ncbi:MAG TPA: hypothetical protein VFI12_04935 [Thermomicrobiales bacterium]|nr:hypothetical protein [Thermomicrobiales bacterium]